VEDDRYRAAYRYGHDWDAANSVWRILAPVDIIFDTTLQTAAALNTSEQIVKQNTIPAGLLSAGRLFVIRVVWARDGVTDATSVTLRIGSAGTTSDTGIFGFANLITGGSARTANSEVWVRPNTTTSLLLANSISGQGFVTNSSDSSGIPNSTSWAIADYTANALIISAYTTQAGSTNHGQVASMIAELRP
jgi:hypothetical protein